MARVLRARVDSQATPQVRLRMWSNSENEPICAPAGAHSTVEVSWVDCGEVTQRIGSKRIPIVRGEAMIVPPHVEHVTGIGALVKATSLWIDAGLISEAEEAFSGVWQDRWTPRVVSPEGATRIAALGNLLRDEVLGAAPGFTLAVDSIAETLAVVMLRDVFHAPSPDREREHGRSVDARILRVLEYVRVHAAEPITLRDLATAAGMSRFHFSRVFRESQGQSPYRFLLETRIANAASLLEKGECNVTEAALSAGFVDLSRFGRLFRRQTGRLPSEMLHARRIQPR